MKHYLAVGPQPRDFHYRGRNCKAVTFDEAKHIYDYLLQVAETHALDLPGRVPGKIYCYYILLADNGCYKC